MGPVWLLSSSMACLPTMTRKGPSFFNELQQGARSHERFNDPIDLDVKRTICAHGQGGSKLLLAICGTDGRDDDFPGTPAFLDPKRFFECNLVKRVDTHLHPVRDYTGAVRLHANAHVVIHNALDTDQDSLHSTLQHIVTRYVRFGRCAIEDDSDALQAIHESASVYR
jgi:hypothetical protein